MRTESNIRPEAAEIEIAANGIAEVILRENITEETREGATMYQYDEYRMPVPYRDNLLENVQKTLDAWMTSARNAEYARLAAEVRAKRDALLAETDKEMCLARLGLTSPEGSTFTAWIGFLKTIASAVFGPMAKYRQALRDVPQQEGFPYSVEFPQPPQETV